MRKLAILTFQTLDGIMQAPSSPEEDRSGGFTQGGWANPCWTEVMAQVEREAMAAPYDLLLGRTTYELFAANVSASDDNNRTAQRLNAAKKFVVTTNPAGLNWQNSEQVTGNIAMQVGQLKRQEGPLLQVHGSWQLIQALLANDLIDEFRLWTFPVIVGAGKRLFANGTPPGTFALTKFETCPCGAFMNFFKPIG